MPEQTVKPSNSTRARVSNEYVDVRAIRENLGLTQAAFSKRYGFSVHTVRKWEQGLRDPETPTKLLLMIIRDRPEFVDRYIKQL